MLISKNLLKIILLEDRLLEEKLQEIREVLVKIILTLLSFYDKVFLENIFKERFFVDFYSIQIDLHSLVLETREKVMIIDNEELIPLVNRIAEVANFYSSPTPISFNSSLLDEDSFDNEHSKNIVLRLNQIILKTNRLMNKDNFLRKV